MRTVSSMTMAVTNKAPGQRLLWGIFITTIVSIVLYYSIFVGNWTQRETLPSNLKNQKKHPDVEFFTKLVTDKEVRVFQKLIKGFMELLPNVTYLMLYGTLLGSYRHHGMIPWDVDVDFIIRLSDMEVANNTFTFLKPESEFKFKPHSKFIWRFFHNESEDTGLPWKWPYLDIFFYSENSTHIWDNDMPHLKFKKSLIFPLIKRPFMGFLLPSPRSPKTILEKMYDLNTCVWTYYKLVRSHSRVKKGRNIRRLSCEFLQSTFPFVKRHDNGTGTIETLEIGNVQVPNSSAFFSEI